MNLHNGVNKTFTSERFCSPRSAVYLKSGYLQAPPNVYFSGNFTITAWVYANSYASHQRILDFGNGQAIDNVFLSFRGPTSSLESSQSGTNGALQSITPPAIKHLKKWYFVSAVVTQGSTARIFINGKLLYNLTDGDPLFPFRLPNNIVKNKNFIGKSN